MKKILLLPIAFLALGLFSCKKDRDCKCTVTHTSSSGNVTTDIDQVTTYTDIRKSGAKSRCQNYTTVNVNSNGGTSTTKGECKLN